MFAMDHATADDVTFWLDLDPALPPEELARKIAVKSCYVIRDDEQPVGIMRYNMFWDVIPFVTLIFLREQFRGLGFGRKAMAQWEDEMREKRHKVALTSTQSDERAQFFYRQIGYSDCGCLILDTVPLRQSLEIFLIKVL
jgi:Acetyltransferases